MVEKSFDNLNPEQKKAVLATEGPVLILAGAGAGKTKTITERIRHIVRTGVSPSEVLAITFTNKAAKEMRERVEKGLREDPMLKRPISSHERPFVSTFHALGVHILREQHAEVGVRKHFTIFDRDDGKRAVKEILATLGLDPKNHEPGEILAVISREKGDGITAEEYAKRAGHGYFGKVVAQVWPAYEKALAREGAFDFDDLLVRTATLLRENQKVLEHYQHTWKYVHVDEYQDTNAVQYEISKLLAGKTRNICVVGDIDQNIYSWRGANIKNILDFEKDYSEAQVIVLEENYRSTKNILDAANAVIEKNKIRRKKNLFTGNSAGEKIGISSSLDEMGEADFISAKAVEFIKSGVSPDEIAVLYRANFQSRVLEEAFMRKDIPYQLLGTKFFERKEVKDVVSYLRAALNPDSLSDLKRIINTPPRGIGKTTIVKLFSGQEESLPAATRGKISSFREILKEIEGFSKQNKPSETMRFIIKKSGLEEKWKEDGDEGRTRLENAYELSNFASRYDGLAPEEGILAFISDTALQSDQDEMKDEQKAVRLMTIHASKGLEFDVVFITGLEEGLFPHQRADNGNKKPEEAEEERRLFYVALTRARKKIFLSYAQTRTVFGSRQVNIPSEFIFDIPETLVEEEDFRGDNTYRRPLLEIEF